MVFLLTFPISGPRLSLEQARDAVKNIVSQCERSMSKQMLSFDERLLGQK